MKRNLLIFILLISTISFGQSPNTWEKVSDFGSDTTGNGIKRERCVGFAIGNYGYVGTGIDTAEIVHNDFWKYDPVLNAWTQVATLPGNVRRNGTGFSIGNKGYVGLGITTVNSSDIGSQILTDFWEYDPTLNTWVQKANFPGNNGWGTYFATGFSVGTKGYICGGKMGPNNYSEQLWEYNPATNQWIQKANFPGGVRYQLSSFSIDDNGYVGLGTDQDLYRNDFWKYNPTTNQWSQIADLPASARSNAATFTIGQRGYVCMGTNGGLLDDLWEYNPFNNQWNVRANYGGTRRKGAVGFSINNRGYVGTGKGYSGKKASFQKYYPPAVVGIEELENEIAIYPNPVRDVLHISTNNNTISHIEIYNLSGQVVQNYSWNSEINVSDISTGNYILVGKNMNGQTIAQQKLIKL